MTLIDFCSRVGLRSVPVAMRVRVEGVDVVLLLSSIVQCTDRVASVTVPLWLVEGVAWHKVKHWCAIGPCVVPAIALLKLQSYTTTKTMTYYVLYLWMVLQVLAGVVVYLCVFDLEAWYLPPLFYMIHVTRTCYIQCIALLM